MLGATRSEQAGDEAQKRAELSGYRAGRERKRKERWSEHPTVCLVGERPPADNNAQRRSQPALHTSLVKAVH
jgi:hypothetical protein